MKELSMNVCPFCKIQIVDTRGKKIGVAPSLNKRRASYILAYLTGSMAFATMDLYSYWPARKGTAFFKPKQ